MKLNLLILCISTFVLCGCKKENPTNSEFPATYQFKELGNLSPVFLFTKDTVLDDPNHPITKHDEVNNFEDLKELTRDYYKNMSITLLSADSLKMIDEFDLDWTFKYVKQGNKIICDDGTILELKNEQLTFSRFYGYARNGNKEKYPDGVINLLSLEQAVQNELDAGDTAAVRTYDFIYLKH